MNDMSWSVFGMLFVLAEFAVGSFYLLAIGLAFIYPAIADFVRAPADTQYGVLMIGVLLHVLIVKVLHKPAVKAVSSDIGQPVEVLEWLDECSARVRYLDRDWEADKLKSEMPETDHAIIHSMHGSRLIISTE